MEHGLNHRRWLFVALYLALSVLVAGIVWRVAEKAALDQLAAQGQADLALAGDGLRNELGRFRSLAVVLASHPDAFSLLAENQPVGQADFLLELAGKTGALDLILVNAQGREIATASDGIAQDHGAAPYFARAKDGAMGVYHLQSQRYGRRTFLFAAPVFGEAGPVQGALIVAVDVEAIEAGWRGDTPAVFFTDELGVIFTSNRSELVLRQRKGDSRSTGLTAEYVTGSVAPFREVSEGLLRGYKVWRMDGARYLPDLGLYLEKPLPDIGLVGEALFDVAPARGRAALQATIAAVLMLGLGAVMFWLAERRRVLAALNTTLEARVAARTRDLQALNADLKREVAERRATESALLRAQADLVQAGKLAALGQMSAGISHELNQPLMAIQSFAENANAFLAKSRTDAVAQNLSRISDLAQRMGRIIRNLRAFARAEPQAIGAVDLVAVVNDALDLLKDRLDKSEIIINWNAGDAMWVRGGEVRLQQVVMNLIGNAIDAMEMTQTRHLSLAVLRDNTRVMLEVRDTGPGLAEPDKIFEPFYSTKQTANTEGLGLGLSISYGLVQSFGGDIRGRNDPAGGAVFTVTLDAADREAAA